MSTLYSRGELQGRWTPCIRGSSGLSDTRFSGKCGVTGGTHAVKVKGRSPDRVKHRCRLVCLQEHSPSLTCNWSFHHRTCNCIAVFHSLYLLLLAEQYLGTLALSDFRHRTSLASPADIGHRACCLFIIVSHNAGGGELLQH